MSQTKIIIAGIGGVGGYFGGMLAKHFEVDQAVEISFVARGHHLQQIRKNGLKVIHGRNNFVARPAFATDNPSEIGIADFIIVSTKSYDLEVMMHQLQPCIDKETVILPLLNGVNSRDNIRKIFPDNLVLDGCVYIVSRLKEAGTVENSANIQSLYFGLDDYVDERLILIEKLFKQANIDAKLSQSISVIIWEKFIFLSPTATATSYFDKCIGEVLSDPEAMKVITALIEEVQQVAQAKQIAIPEDITALTLAKLNAMPFETTSSMHSDFKMNKPHTELESLTGYVIGEGRKYAMDTPVFQVAYDKLSGRSEN